MCRRVAPDRRASSRSAARATRRPPSSGESPTTHVLQSTSINSKLNVVYFVRVSGGCNRGECAHEPDVVVDAAARHAPQRVRHHFE